MTIGDEMRILVTGSKGMLGTDLLSELSSQEVCGVDIDTLDICSLHDVISYTHAFKPQVVINCAAFTNVDVCETELITAYKVNSIGPKNLAIACNKLDVPLLQISTDYIFDGEKGSEYLEGDVVNPLSVYGRSKLDGENFIKGLTNKYFIVRTQSLYGKHGNNFVKTILKTARDKGILKVVNDQTSNPTYTKDLCVAIRELIETENYGTFHVTNAGAVTWYEFTKEILKQTGIENVSLTPCTTAEFPRPAKRPAYSPLKNFYWELCGFRLLRDHSEALKDYLAEMQF